MNASGEWKLGGLEYVSNVEGNHQPPVKLPSFLEIYDPPEKNDTSKLKLSTKWLVELFFINIIFLINGHVFIFVQFQRYVGPWLFSMGII